MANIRRPNEIQVAEVVGRLMRDHGMSNWYLDVNERLEGAVTVSIRASLGMKCVNGFINLAEAKQLCLFAKDFFKLPQGGGFDEPAGFEDEPGHPMQLQISFTQCFQSGQFQAKLTEDRYTAQMGGLMVSLIDEIGTDADAYYLCHAARILGTGTAHAAWVIHGTTNATSDELRRAVDEIMNPPVEQLVELLMQDTPPEVEATLARHSENEFATESQNQAWGTF